MQRTIPIIVSSESTTGSVPSADGSLFTVNFEEGLNIPKEAKNIQCRFDSASIWNVIHNITTANNKVTITANIGMSSATRTIAIPAGLYTVSTLQAACEVAMLAEGFSSSPYPFTMTGNEAQQKIEMKINTASVAVNFTASDTFRDIIGFDSKTIGAGSIRTVTGESTAAFNTIEYFLIHSDIVDVGLRYGNTYSQVVGRVLINKGVGEQLIVENFNPPLISAQKLAGSKKRRFTFWLTDHLNVRVNTHGESWSVRLTISYFI